jgi:hypothetical protein
MGDQVGRRRESGITVSKNDDRCATCFIHTRSEEPYRANCCARYPLPEGVGEYLVSSLVRSKRTARTSVLFPVGTPYHGTGKHCSVGKVLTTAMLPPSRHSWQGVQMGMKDTTRTQTLGTVTTPLH